MAGPGVLEVDPVLGGVLEPKLADGATGSLPNPVAASELAPRGLQPGTYRSKNSRGPPLPAVGHDPSMPFLVHGQAVWRSLPPQATSFLLGDSWIWTCGSAGSGEASPWPKGRLSPCWMRRLGLGMEGGAMGCDNLGWEGHGDGERRHGGMLGRAQMGNGDRRGGGTTRASGWAMEAAS